MYTQLPFDICLVPSLSPSPPPSWQVAAVSGDARRALVICRRATELAASDHPTTASSASSKKKRKQQSISSSSAVVSTAHINRAVQEMFSSPKIVAIW